MNYLASYFNLIQKEIFFMNRPITINEIIDTPIRVLSKYPPDQLEKLIKHIIKRLALAQHAKVQLEAALRAKYEDRAHAKRAKMSKDTGIIHIEDEGFRFSMDVPKKVTWDQHGLKIIRKKLLNGGENPDDFIRTTYSVLENDYKSWDNDMQSLFMPARTLKTGNATYKLVKLDSKNGAKNRGFYV